MLLNVANATTRFHYERVVLLHENQDTANNNVPPRKQRSVEYRGCHEET
jgi:hypothetical protein